MKMNGYLMVRVTRDSPYFAMASSKNRKAGYIPEHRWIMAQSIGRPLTRREVVHHINGDRSDNRLENLLLLANSTEHAQVHLNQRKPGHKIDRPSLRIWLTFAQKQRLTEIAAEYDEGVVTYCKRVLLRHASTYNSNAPSNKRRVAELERIRNDSGFLG